MSEQKTPGAKECTAHDTKDDCIYVGLSNQPHTSLPIEIRALMACEAWRLSGMGYKELAGKKEMFCLAGVLVT